MEYDFKALSGYDFELLVCDLLSAERGRVIEGFRQGRDQGIDLRYALEEGGTVIQCKHYANTSFSGLRAAVEKEVPKLRRLSPARYLLVTSRFLTPAEKDRLLAAAAPFCRSGEDILGGSELNALLRRHPEVERAHYKLWLTSTAVLEKLLHSELYQQSAMLREEIEGRLRLYVQSAAAFGKAQELLRRENCCIISGIPGIGKTTLAEILLIHYLDQGYEIVKVRSDIREAVAAYRPGRRQIFFYDDFLGSTSLELLGGKNEGENLLSFLNHIAGDSGKKFILTTREYILNQARQSVEAFGRERFDYRKCVISLEDYTRTDRARILYNHLYFYRASRADVVDLLEEDRVLKIVDHPNYSPRLIETVVKLRRSSGEGSFFEFFTHMLSHPNRLWEHAFQRQLSPAARDLLLLLGPAKNVVSLKALERSYEQYHDAKSRLENRSLRTTDFKDALKETEGTFIKVGRIVVSYHNPSVRDFIHSFIRENPAEFRILCETAADFEYCVKLAQLDPALCGRYQETYMAALRRTIEQENDGSRIFIWRLSRWLRELSAVSGLLDLPEVWELMQEETARLLDLLESACGEIEACSEIVDPNDLKNFLEEVDVPAFPAALRKRLWDVFLRYAAAWCGQTDHYRIDDFLLFPALGALCPIDLSEERFLCVHRLLEDFRDTCDDDSLQDIACGGDCDQYIDGIRRLEQFFDINLSGVRAEAEEKRYWIQEYEDLREEEDRIDASQSGRGLGSAEIVGMFQGLLDREDEEKDCW